MPSVISDLLESVEELLRARREDLRRSTGALLASVEVRLEAHRELRRLRGENFNVFQLLQIESAEDELHSRFIAELLDPGGTHDQGTTFLHAFQNQVGRELGGIDWIRAENATVKREKFIGPVVIDGESSTGGRIDIFISDHERHLSIENKIWSGEGEKQITRYCNYPPDRPDQNLVLFLTLHGGKADTEKENYRAISYAEHILPWLESCQRLAADLPILRETIKQYIITVRRLTGGLTVDGEIKDAMKRHYRAAWEIRQAFDHLFSEHLQDLVLEVRNRIEQAQQGGWLLRQTQKPPGLVLDHENWGGTQVIWEYDWVGIRVPAESRVNHADVHTNLAWCDARKSTNEAYWVYVPRERFNNAEGIEHLFDESKRRKLAEDLKEKIVTLAEYCDRELPPDGPN